MDKDYTKETIKFLTEWLKGIFALLILDTTAIATLLVRQKFFKNNFEYDLLILAFLLDIIIFFILITVSIHIFKLIKSLKQ